VYAAVWQLGFTLRCKIVWGDGWLCHVLVRGSDDVWVICGVHSVAFVRTVSLCVHVAVHPGSGDWVLILPDVWRLLDRRTRLRRSLRRWWYLSVFVVVWNVSSTGLRQLYEVVSNVAFCSIGLAHLEFLWCILHLLFFIVLFAIAL